MDYSNWMHNTLALIGPQPLRTVSMPASHDAGMSSSNDCNMANQCNTKTQTTAILGQLQAGVRYFDIRPTIYKNTLYTAHLDDTTGFGCNGESMQNVLSDVVTFIGRSGDLVILKFSHYYDRDNNKSGFSQSQRCSS